METITTTQNITAQAECPAEIFRRMTHQEQCAYLLGCMRQHLALPPKYTDELLAINLIFLLSQDEHTAVRWSNYVEAHFGIALADEEDDIYFFTDINIMVNTVMAHLK